MRAAKAVFLFGLGVLALAVGLEMLRSSSMGTTEAQAQVSVDVFVGVADGPWDSSRTIALTRDGAVFIMDPGSNIGTLRYRLPSGNYVALVVDSAARLAVTDDGRVYQCDVGSYSENDALVRDNPDSPIAAHWPNAQLWLEEDGDLYKADQYYGSMSFGAVPTDSESFGEIKSQFGNSEQ